MAACYDMMFLSFFGGHREGGVLSYESLYVVLHHRLSSMEYGFGCNFPWMHVSVPFGSGRDTSFAILWRCG